MNPDNPERLKYSIKTRLQQLSAKEHERVMKLLLTAIVPASRSTFYRWLQTKQSEKFEIPYTKQKEIAAVFDCSIEDLSYPSKQ